MKKLDLKLQLIMKINIETVGRKIKSRKSDKVLEIVAVHQKPILPYELEDEPQSFRAEINYLVSGDGVVKFWLEHTEFDFV